MAKNTQRTDTFSDVTKTEYDLAGNAIKQIDAKNKNTFIVFDPRNRRKSTTDRISAATTFTYTALGQLASLKDPESQATSYTFDARGSKLTEQYPDHTGGSTVGQSGYGIVTFVYDNAGRVLRKQDQVGDTCTYNFDLAGRMTSRNYRTAANSPSGTIADTDKFTFDRSSRMLTAVSGRYTNTVGYAFDPAGRKASESLTIASQTYTVGTEFNTRNELIKYTYPDSSIANRAYTARGALNELKLDSSVIDTRTYDDGGRMTSEVLGNGITETRAYRTDNLLSTISFSNTNIGNLTYSWAERTSICAEVETQIHTMIERKLEAGQELNLELVNGIIESMDPPESYAPSDEPILQAEPVLQAEPIATASKQSPRQVFSGYIRQILNRPKRTTPALDWVAIGGLVVACFGPLLIAIGMARRAEGPAVFGFLMLFVGVAASGISFWRIRHSNGLLTGQRIASAGLLMLPLSIADAVLSAILFASPFGRFLGAIVMAAALLYANYRVFQAAMHWLDSYSAKAPEGEFAKTETNRDPEAEPGQFSGVTG